MGGKQNYDRASEVSWLVLIFITGLVWFVYETLKYYKGKTKCEATQETGQLSN